MRLDVHPSQGVLGVFLAYAKKTWNLLAASLSIEDGDKVEVGGDAEHSANGQADGQPSDCTGQEYRNGHFEQITYELSE